MDSMIEDEPHVEQISQRSFEFHLIHRINASNHFFQTEVNDTATRRGHKLPTFHKIKKLD
jgi:hypothetical protein